MKLRLLYLMLAGFVFLTTALFVRTTGIHIDEKNYLNWAIYGRTGDSIDTGKPPLFYWMNYKLHHEIARSFGPLKPVTIYLFYIAAFAASLVWAVRPEFGDKFGRLSLAFLVLLLAPLAVLNATQVMMETAILPVVSLLFGAVFRGGERYWKLLLLFLLSAVLIALKATGAAVVVLLAAVALRRSWRITVALGIGALSGFLGNKATLRWIVQSKHAIDYGGPAEVLNPAAVYERLTFILQDLYVWLFFTGIATAAGVLVCVYSRWRSRTDSETAKGRMSDGGLVALALGSLALMLLMQGISIHGFPRYNYPVLWLGLIASVILVARHNAIALIPLAALFGFQSSALWGRDLDRFDRWPTRTVLEFMESGGTILTGMPIHRLVVAQHFRNPSPCYAVESIHPDEETYYLEYLAFAFPKGTVAGSPPSCAPAIRVWRDPVEKAGGCPARCNPSNRWNICSYQRLTFYTVRQGLVLNQVCW